MYLFFFMALFERQRKCLIRSALIRVNPRLNCSDSIQLYELNSGRELLELLSSVGVVGVQFECAFILHDGELAISVHGMRCGDAVVDVRAVWIKKHVELEDLESFLRLSTAIQHAVNPIVEIILARLESRVLAFEFLIDLDRVFVTA